MEQILAIVGVVILVAALVFLLTKEKYRKYAVILIPFIAFLLLYIFKKKDKKLQNAEAESEFKIKLNDVKADMHEAKTIAELKTKYIKKDDKKNLEQLEEITKTQDKTKRRKKLADMIG